MLYIYVRRTANAVGALVLLAVLLFAVARSVQPQDLPRGEALYTGNCAACHGSAGEGTSRAVALNPAAGRSAFLQAWEAEHASLFASMSASDREELWNTVQSLRPVPSPTPPAAGPARPVMGTATPAMPSNRTPTAQPTLPSGDMAAGASLYAQRCARCHGERAEGTVRGPLLRNFAEPTAFLDAWATSHTSLFAEADEAQRAALWSWLESIR